MASLLNLVCVTGLTYCACLYLYIIYMHCSRRYYQIVKCHGAWYRHAEGYIN